jgi:hypothetical protein
VSDLSSKEQALLAAVRKEWGPARETSEAVRAALPVRLAAEPALGDAAPGPGAPSSAPGLLRGPLGLGLGAVVVGLCVAGALWRKSPPSPEARPAPPAITATLPVSAPPPSAATPAPPPEPVAVSLDSLPSAAAPLPTTAPRAVPSAASEDDLAAEVALLQAAQKAQRAGAPAEALAALAQHARRFPRGALREERMTLQVRAQCDSGNVAAARATMDELAKSAPGSSHLKSLSNSCAAR